MRAAALIFSATAFLRYLFGCGALLSAALIFSATISLWRLFGIFPWVRRLFEYLRYVHENRFSNFALSHNQIYFNFFLSSFCLILSDEGRGLHQTEEIWRPKRQDSFYCEWRLASPKTGKGSLEGHIKVTCSFKIFLYP